MEGLQTLVPDERTLVILRVDTDNPATLQMLQSRLETVYVAFQFLVVPKSVEVFGIPGRGVYHKETIGAYSVEAFAQNEEDLKLRIAFVQRLADDVCCSNNVGSTSGAPELQSQAEST